MSWLSLISHRSDLVAAGINGRRETAYVNADKNEYPQAEAQNPNIIANADCDILSRALSSFACFMVRIG